ncbi:MAG TPA: alpha/beta fold hydrolase [Acidimicrobiales bacterium]|nr:alpha/beta fold hydrolase [Acidimicrobiales bacterium]
MSAAPVICLHGFPEQPSAFDSVASSLRAAGFDDVHVPSQRGYDPARRPVGRSSYRTEELATDVLRYADANGIDRFHLVGHDWGAILAWWLAANVPSRLLTMTSLAVPHPKAMGAVALRSNQLLKSYYVGLFQIPGLPERALLSGGGRRFRDALSSSGLAEARADEYVRAMSEPGALTAAISWYRGASIRMLLTLPDVVDVPVLYVWGSDDLALSRAAAEATTRYVRSRYRFLPLEGASHWLPQEHSELFVPALVEHLQAADGAT